MSFDYVIVGAGSAGCVLARRLVDAGASVLLLEAGPDDRRMEIRIPAAFSKLFKTEVDWDYRTTEEPSLDGRSLYVPRGKVVGGSSAMNAMLSVRGHAADYDGWAADGCDGWSWRDVVPYFERQLMPVADLRCVNELSRAFLGACSQSDLNVVPAIGHDPDVRDAFGPYRVNQRRGRRATAADAYLKTVRSRGNLLLVARAEVRHLLLDSGRAVGVAYGVDGQQHRAHAGEVILCAGTVGSPHLLLRSGIGPADQLRTYGLDVAADLPGVGCNLQDHPYAPINWQSLRPVSLADAEGLGNLLRFLVAGRGPLTSTVAEVGGFLRTLPELDAPDVQLCFAPTYFVEHAFSNPEGHGLACAVTLLTPRSRGRVALQPGDPSAPPRIESRALSDDGEVETLRRGVEIVRDIVRRPAMEPYLGEIYPRQLDLDDADSIRRHVRAATELLYHPVGTCRMGVGSDAVVDPELRVHGVDGLRVVDASVMPVIPRGNTATPTMMIAERAADLISNRAMTLP